MRVHADMARCTGLGLCESIAPEFFEIQDDGTLAVLRSDVEEADRAVLTEAIRACPTEALRIEG
ncbi:ferredoxin [Pseudonocardia hispaniensis]|uniref:Ferredoxin n=1 Tax=Pseudonocardia hispaniensis TaxID=904933 RepID=A0ABW1J2H5_9PSEU